MPSKPRVVYWFRTDLRLHDSPALQAALDLEPEVFYPIWTWDPHYVYRARVGPNRWQFLIDCQADLSASLTRLNKKQKLHVIREAPQTLFPKLFKLWKISHLVFEKDTDAYARDRDEVVMKLAREAGVEVIVKVGRTLYDPDALVKANGNKPTMSMSQVQHASSSLGEPAKPIPAPKSIPDPGDTDLSSIDHEVPSPNPDVNAVHRSNPDTSYDSRMGPKKNFAVPTLAELGISKATSPHRGGESIGLAILESVCLNEQYTATFEKPRTAPSDFQPQATTLLSPHLHFGSLSVREFYWRVEAVIQKQRKQGNHVSTIPTNLPGQLLFREMYFGAQAALGYSYAQAHGNKICRFVDWHLPSHISNDPAGEHLLSGTYLVDNLDAERYFRRWKHGRTGFPWIDALMRQLKHEGWIHHLGRHAVACFLTRGGCYVHWERGAEVFEEWLLDHEVACNAGNWMWLSCTAFFSQFYRCYSPIAFGRKTDPEGKFIRHYVPELKHFDKKYIYEPWKAPIADQKAWGCRIEGDGGQDLDVEEEKQQKKGKGEINTYPKPMFDFNERRRFCIDKVKAAYAVGLYGDDPRVLNGKWRDIFDFEIEKGAGQTLDEENGEVKDANGHNERHEGAKAKDSSHPNDNVDDVESDDKTAQPSSKKSKGTKRTQTRLDFERGHKKKAKKGH